VYTYVGEFNDNKLSHFYMISIHSVGIVFAAIVEELHVSTNIWATRNIIITV